jgi:hypothetical protein
MSRGRPADPPRGARPTQLRLGLRPSPPQRRPPTPPKWSTFRPAPPDHYSTGLDSRGFESHQPLQKTCKSAPFMYSVLSAHYAEGPGFDRRLPISVSACTQSSSGRVKRTLSARRSGFPEPGDNWGTEPSAPNDRRSDRGPGWDAAARSALCLTYPLRRPPTIGSRAPHAPRQSVRRTRARESVASAGEQADAHLRCHQRAHARAPVRRGTLFQRARPRCEAELRQPLVAGDLADLRRGRAPGTCPRAPRRRGRWAGRACPSADSVTASAVARSTTAHVLGCLAGRRRSTKRDGRGPCLRASQRELRRFLSGPGSISVDSPTEREARDGLDPLPRRSRARRPRDERRRQVARRHGGERSSAHLRRQRARPRGDEQRALGAAGPSSEAESACSITPSAYLAGLEPGCPRLAAGVAATRLRSRRGAGQSATIAPPTTITPPIQIHATSGDTINRKSATGAACV